MPDKDGWSRLTVITPAYDEMPNLRELLPAIRASLSTIPKLHSEILVVVPRLTNTADRQEIRTLGGKPILRGPLDTFGDAIRSGIAAVDPRSDLVVIMDADGSHAPESIPRLVAESSGAHVVVASRYIAGGETDNSAALRLMSRALNFAYRVILGIDCKDVSTNFKLYRAEDLRRVTLSMTNFDVVEELMYRLKVLHGKDLVIREIPDRFFGRKHGVTKRKLGPFVVSYLKTLIQLTWHDRTRKG
jgi:dolichol-phosphate mannosyltransferase